MYCCNYPRPHLWYFCEKASNTVKKIKIWMKAEEANSRFLAGCNEAVVLHLEQMKDDLEAAITVDVDTEQGNMPSGTDSDE
jgi:hypothetical protein